ncbi:Der1-like family-domain-containing protein [Dipodascopsis tothii]|uniref:Der1-like family-domain-containing protein n=1 Tax=Dipodascopsis tothii TaxID=44089 RepID=UPI0034CEF0C3
MANELIDFVRSVAPVTRTFLFGSLATVFGGLLHVVNPSYLVNFWPYVIYRAQIWRPVTAFFVIGGGSPISKFMDAYMLYTYSKDLENDKFSRATADYLYYVVFLGTIIVGLNVFTGAAVYSAPLLTAMTFTWSQETPDRIVQFYFGFQFKAKYLPAVMIVYNLLVSGPDAALIAATGIAAAFLYWRLDKRQGPSGNALPPSRWALAPPWLKRLLPGSWSPGTGRTTGPRTDTRSYGSAFFPGEQARRSAPSAPATGHSTSSSTSSPSSNMSFRWGRGQRLGG